MNQKRIFIPSSGALSWQTLLAEPEKHWKPGCSAFSLAESWEQSAGLPPAIASLFQNSPDPSWHKTQLALAIPEYKVNLDGGGHPSQNDVFALLSNPAGLIAMMVEGKCREDFDVTVADWFKRTSSQGATARMNHILDCLGLMTKVPDTIRYQLLHRAASAVIEAQRFHATTAILVIQSFVADDTENHYPDFKAFVQLFGQTPAKDQLIPLSTSGRIKLWAAWVQS